MNMLERAAGAIDQAEWDELDDPENSEAHYTHLARAALLAALDPEDEALVLSLAAVIAAEYIKNWPVEQTANAFALMDRPVAINVARAAIMALKQTAQGGKP